MRTFRLALAQINTTVGDLEGNTQKILKYIDEARDLGADLVAFPELAIPGYPPEDLVFKPQFLKANLRKLDEVVAASKDIAVVVGFVDTNADIYNAAALAYDGRLIGVYHKMYLPNYGVFDEKRYFKSGTECPVYVINGTAVGVNICEDIWYAVGPATVQAVAGAELIVNINGSPFHAGKEAFRKKMLATRASDNELFVAYLNLVGGQDELVFDGASMVLDPRGDLILRGSQFEEELLAVDLDIEYAFRSLLVDPSSRRERPELLKEVGESKRVHVSDCMDLPRPTIPAYSPITYDSVGEVYAALALGTKDYVHKNGFSKVLVGMSGGIDSSLVAVIAADALGKENVLGVAMPSMYSSEGSIVDAKLVAENLGIDLWVIPIEDTFSVYLNMLSSRFSGTEEGVAEENLQARIRGNTLMAISNKFGWLVLTTGNKSELGVGYSTLYGDMAGGFAVIKDVPKTSVYKLAGHRNSQGHKPPIPDSVFEKPPSAELRPEQTDQDTLPPYELLDPILRAYVEEDRSFGEIVGMGFDESVVKRVINMVDRNEYKRRQAPPGVKITPRNFGRDRRMPIANRYRPF